MPEYLPFLLIALACPIIMGTVMWFLMKGMRGDHAAHRSQEQMPPREQGGSAGADLRSAPARSEQP